MDYYKLNELPETYKRCKAFTKDFQKWLSKEMVQRQIDPKQFQKAHGYDGKVKKQGSIPINAMVTIAKEIVQSGVPLTDTSGLRDATDAIRLRKEVLQFYRLKNKDDDGHRHIIDVLANVLDVFNRTGESQKQFAREHGIVDETPVQIFVHFPDRDELDDEDDEFSLQEAQTSDASKAPKKARVPVANPLADSELQLEHEFQVLCFFYDFNQLRQVAKSVWIDYKERKVELLTAATITDIAQAIIQQRVAGLVDELQSDGEDRTLWEIIRRLFLLMIAKGAPAPGDDAYANEEWRSLNPQIYDLLCIEPLTELDAWWTYRNNDAANTPQPPPVGSRHFSFLAHFDRIRNIELKPPAFDKFTAGMVSKAAPEQEWLAFGFQVIIDVQNILFSDTREVFTDIAEHTIRLSTLMREHIEYEDDRWGNENKPDYMTVGETKFSSVYLTALPMILDWVKQLLDEKTPAGMDLEPKFGTPVFLSLHPVLAGIVGGYFHRIYHGNAISKVTWFITALAHLYNACRQLFDIKVWPDLEFILKMHGGERIFVGNAPSNPDLFHSQLAIALCASSRMFSSDYHKWTRANPESRDRRGLRVYLPLESMIRDYYCDAPPDRWLSLHNLFAHLVNLGDKDDTPTSDDSETAKQSLGDLQETFACIAGKLRPKGWKKKMQKGKSPRVSAPNFSDDLNVHADSLYRANATLRDHELHANFDYLGFYRRAYDLVLRVRKEVLCHHDQRSLLSDDSSNSQLLFDLFRSLKLHEKDPEIKTTGDEISADVHPLDKLKHISVIMSETIAKEGRAELLLAKQAMRRDLDDHDLGEYARFFETYEEEEEISFEPEGTQGTRPDAQVEIKPEAHQSPYPKVDPAFATERIEEHLALEISKFRQVALNEPAYHSSAQADAPLPTISESDEEEGDELEAPQEARKLNVVIANGKATLLKPNDITEPKAETAPSIKPAPIIIDLGSGSDEESDDEVGPATVGNFISEDEKVPCGDVQLLVEAEPDSGEAFDAIITDCDAGSSPAKFPCHAPAKQRARVHHRITYYRAISPARKTCVIRSRKHGVCFFKPIHRGGRKHRVLHACYESCAFWAAVEGLKAGCERFVVKGKMAGKALAGYKWKRHV